MPAPTLTAHARQRWCERFPALDPAAEWASARRAPKALVTRIAQRCRPEARQPARFLVSRGDVVFVVDRARDVVITVFPVE